MKSNEEDTTKAPWQLVNLSSRNIDRLAYELYGLTPSEIQIVENPIKG